MQSVVSKTNIKINYAHKKYDDEKIMVVITTLFEQTMKLTMNIKTYTILYANVIPVIALLLSHDLFLFIVLNAKCLFFLLPRLYLLPLSFINFPVLRSAFSASFKK